MMKEISENEYQILQVLRDMRPRDKVSITKQSPRASTEFVVWTEKITFIERGVDTN